MVNYMAFSDRDYTRESVIKQAGLIELHCKDGSAIDAGCACIDTKHLFLIEGLSEEGKGFALSEKERRFYEQLGVLSRLIRKKLEVEDYDLHGVMHEAMKHGNPISHLTACEKKRERCIQKLKPKEERGEIESAHAVCHASIPCSP